MNANQWIGISKDIVNIKMFVDNDRKFLKFRYVPDVWLKLA